MKKKDIIIVILVILNILLFLQNLNIDIIEDAKAQMSLSAEGVQFNTVKAKKIYSEKVYTNQIYIMGYDVLKVNENLVNMLISRKIITYSEAKKIMDGAKNKNWLEDVIEKNNEGVNNENK